MNHRRVRALHVPPPKVPQSLSCAHLLLAGSSTLRLFLIVSHSSHLFAQRFSVPPRRWSGLSASGHTQRFVFAFVVAVALGATFSPFVLEFVEQQEVMRSLNWQRTMISSVVFRVRGVTSFVFAEGCNHWKPGSTRRRQLS
jgi:hypothetical protein